MVLLAAKSLDQRVAALPILPLRIWLPVKKQRAIPGIFGIDVDLPREDGGPYDVGRPELQPAFHGHAVRPEQRQDHVAEQGAFGVDFRGHDHRTIAPLRERAKRSEGEEKRGGGGERANETKQQLFQIWEGLPSGCTNVNASYGEVEPPRAFMATRIDVVT